MGATIYTFDTEATGLSPVDDEIVQLTIVKYEVGKPWADMEGYTALFGTEKPLPAGETLFCGIEPSELVGKPTIGECLDTILDIFQQGSVFLAYNAYFDITMLRAAIEHAGLRRKLPMTMRNTIDPMMFARGLYPNVRGRKLEQMAARLGVSVTKSHEATWDSLAAAEVMVRMTVQHNLPKDLEALTTLQLQYADGWSRRTNRPLETW